MLFVINKHYTSISLINPCRLLLKDALPLTEDHFVIGNTPANLRLGLDIGGTDVEWNDSTIDLSAPSIMADPASSSPFLYEFVEVDPIN